NPPCSLQGTPVSGSPCQLCGALEPLFGPGSPDDLVTLAESDARTLRSDLRPELVELCVERLDLLDHRRIASLRKRVPESHPSLAQLLDLGVVQRDGVHGDHNDPACPNIPVTNILSGEARRGRDR